VDDFVFETLGDAVLVFDNFLLGKQVHTHTAFLVVVALALALALAVDDTLALALAVDDTLALAVGDTLAMTVEVRVPAAVVVGVAHVCCCLDTLSSPIGPSSPDPRKAKRARQGCHGFHARIINADGDTRAK
jgi:hypothetical protein